MKGYTVTWVEVTGRRERSWFLSRALAEAHAAMIRRWPTILAVEVK